MTYVLIVVSAALIAIGITGLRNALRKPVPPERIRDELVAALGRRFEHVSVVEKDGLKLKLKNTRGEEATMHLDNLVSTVAKVGSARVREMVYAKWLKPMEPFASEVAPVEVPLSEQLDRVMPRLIHREALEQFPKAPVHRQIGQTPLHVALVLDDEAAVQYISQEKADESGLSADELEERAMENLRRLWPREQARELIEKTNSVNVIAAGDTYEAARVLLLPEYLEAGEVVAAVVPDRDSLKFMAPERGAEINWELMAKLAENPVGERLLFNRPLRVTNLGIEVR